MGKLNVSEQVYRALNKWSWSTAKHVLECPAEAFDQRKRPIDKTDAMQLGTLMHMALLEPQLIDEHYVVAPEIRKGLGGWTYKGADQTWRLKKEAEAHLTETLGDRFKVTEELMLDIKSRVRGARDLLRTYGSLDLSGRKLAIDAEVAMVGQIEGCAVKGKADLLIHDGIIDVKTTADIRPTAVGRTAIQRHWLGQVWTYGELAKQCGYPIRKYGVIVIQSPKVSGTPMRLSSSRQPRPSWRLMWLSEEAIAYGESEAKRVWRTVRDCEATGNWPDYDCNEITLPRWAKAEVVEEEIF